MKDRMKVAELIEKLQKAPRDADVVFEMFDTDVAGIKSVDVIGTNEGQKVVLHCDYFWKFVKATGWAKEE